MRKADKLLGTLDLLVLRTLAAGNALHGCDIADRIHEMSQDALQVEEGSLYPALHRMEESGWLSSEWSASANNRRARYYRITRAGKQRVAAIEREWTAHVNAVMRVLKHA
jgi:transcriptional regulator